MKMKILTTALALLLSQSMLSAKVHAVVNGENLTDADLKPMLQMFNAKSIDELDENKKKMLLDQSVEKKLISQVAKKDKINENPEFKKIMDDFQNRLLVDFWMKQKFDDLTVSDDDIKKYIEHNKKSSIQVNEDINLRENAKMQKFQVLIDETLSTMKKNAKIEYK